MLNDSEAGRKVDRSCCLSNTAFLIGNRNYFTHSAKELSKLKQYCNITLSSYLIKNSYSHPDVENSIRTASENHNITSFRRSEEHTSELQSRGHIVCRLLLEKKK